MKAGSLIVGAVAIAVAAPGAAAAQSSTLSGTGTLLTSPGQASVFANYRVALQRLRARAIAARDANGGVLTEEDRAIFQRRLDDIQRRYRNNKVRIVVDRGGTPLQPR